MGVANNNKMKKSVSKRVNEGSLRTFTQSDWYSFAGASNFDDGTAPMIYEYDGDPEITMIVSGDVDSPYAVIELYIDEDAYSKIDYRGKSAAISLATKLINKIESNTLDIEDLEDMDFRKSY